jgi:chemotaxis protein histidine kinase CheA
MNSFNELFISGVNGMFAGFFVFCEEASDYKKATLEALLARFLEEVELKKNNAPAVVETPAVEVEEPPAVVETPAVEVEEPALAPAVKAAAPKKRATKKKEAKSEDEAEAAVVRVAPKKRATKKKEAKSEDEAEATEAEAAAPKKRATKKKEAKSEDEAEATEAEAAAPKKRATKKKEAKSEDEAEATVVRVASKKRATKKEEVVVELLPREQQTPLKVLDLTDGAWVKKAKADFLKALCKERGLVATTKGAMVKALTKYEEDLGQTVDTPTHKMPNVRPANVDGVGEWGEFGAPLTSRPEIVVVRKYNLDLIDTDRSFMFVVEIADNKNFWVVGVLDKRELRDQKSDDRVDVHALKKKHVKVALDMNLMVDYPDNLDA